MYLTVLFLKGAMDNKEFLDFVQTISVSASKQFEEEKVRVVLQFC
jgi:hypothetical protein